MRSSHSAPLHAVSLPGDVTEGSLRAEAGEQAATDPQEVEWQLVNCLVHPGGQTKCELAEQATPENRLVDNRLGAGTVSDWQGAGPISVPQFRPLLRSMRPVLAGTVQGL